jgi:hypothetical protein
MSRMSCRTEDYDSIDDAVINGLVAVPRPCPKTHEGSEDRIMAKRKVVGGNIIDIYLCIYREHDGSLVCSGSQ